MKNTILSLLFLSAVLFSCNSGGGEESTAATEENKNTENLSTDMINNEGTAAEETPAEPVGGNAKFEFEQTDWDFGKINQGDEVEHVFKFKNTGTEPLVISDAKGTCGCTVPSYPKEPIAPGESSEILVHFSSKGKQGVQRKSVNITANTTPNRTTLNITSEVIVPGAEETAK